MLDSVKEVEGPFFIVMEGIDGSGKGTQAQYLYDFIKRTYPHLNPILTREPTKLKSGKLLRNYLKEDVLEPEALGLFFAADRFHHVCEVILPNLKRGRCVISERYVYSSLVYQSATGVDLTWLTEINRYAVIPDLMVYLSVPPAEAQRRVIHRLEKEKKKKKGRKGIEFFEEKFLSFHEETARRFEALVKGELDVTIKSGNTRFNDFGETTMVTVDGKPLAKIVHSHVAGEAEKLLLGELPRITNNYDYSLVPKDPENIFKTRAPWLREFINTRKENVGEKSVQTRLG